ncbi:hypothetical protein BGZ63DRAFT_10391 [Mariannaea sp. PMI_226]|nr:hypothetical protein BGZ63DRAFT_10391 [Mariannaea sp. PMI_226]
MQVQALLQGETNSFCALSTSPPASALGRERRCSASSTIPDTGTIFLIVIWLVMASHFCFLILLERGRLKFLLAPDFSVCRKGIRVQGSFNLYPGSCGSSTRIPQVATWYPCTHCYPEARKPNSYSRFVSKSRSLRPVGANYNAAVRIYWIRMRQSSIRPNHGSVLFGWPSQIRDCPCLCCRYLHNQRHLRPQRHTQASMTVSNALRVFNLSRGLFVACDELSFFLKLHALLSMRKVSYAL